MPGVYELANQDKQIIYIGQSARDVPNRIRQHLSSNSCVQEHIRYWRYAYSRVPQADEAALIAAFEAKAMRLPKCNQAKPLLRDAKRRYQERSRG